MRPTNDVDTVVDVRADPLILHTFTKTLGDLGFESAGISAEGRQHRWRPGAASIDVLLPDGAGERANVRPGATGSPTVAAPGGTQALARSETVPVTVEGRAGLVRRHRRDFVRLAILLTAADFAAEDVTKTDRRRLRTIVEAIRRDRELLLEVPDASSAIDRLVLAARIAG